MDQLINTVVLPFPLLSLPTALLFMVSCFPDLNDIIHLSCVNHRPRATLIREVFKAVEFRLCKAGFEEMKLLAQSAVREHIVSLYYEVTGFIDPSKYI